MKNLEFDQIDWIIQKIVQWYYIREDNGFGRDPTMADVDHSSLLRVLLSGGKVYKYPPPRSHSYPNYYAVEHETIPMEVWFKKGEDILSESIPHEKIETTDVVPGSVGIDQARWTVLRREGRNLIIQWEKDPAEWVLRLRSQEEFDTSIRERHHASTLDDEEYELSMREHFSKYHRWALKRIPPEE